MATMHLEVRALLATFLLLPAVPAGAGESLTQAIFEDGNVRGGLIVHLGCRDGTLTVALHANECCAVQGLETDPTLLEQARATIRAAKCYGTVSARHWKSPAALPYADNLVDLIVVRQGAYRGTDDELLRVLAPLGRAVFLNSESDDIERQVTKPWPREIDEWTHWLHDAGNGSVARDACVGPPRRMQWVVEPLWSRGHEVPSSTGRVVTARGRIFYVLDKGQTARVLEPDGAPYVNPKLVAQELHKRHKDAEFPSLGVLRGPMGDKQMGLRLLATGGLLDDTWFNRTYWMYASVWPGYYIANLSPKTGQLLSIDADTTYAVQAFTSRTIHSPTLEPGTRGYLLFADGNANEPVLDDRARNRDKGMGFARGAPPKWYQWVPIRIRAMVAAGETLFVAGPHDAAPRDDPYAAIDGRMGARLWAVSTANGRKLAELPLDSPAVFDGLIAAGDRLYVTLMDGSLRCLRPR